MDDYKDIVNNKRPEPNYKHPRMSIYNRSAIFAPFAALTGYKEEINEESRLTDDKIERSDDYKEKINKKLISLDINQNITIEYFVKDSLKKGGKYITKTDKIKKIDYINKTIIMSDKSIIPINNIINIK